MEPDKPVTGIHKRMQTFLENRVGETNRLGERVFRILLPGKEETPNQFFESRNFLVFSYNIITPSPGLETIREAKNIPKDLSRSNYELLY